MTLSTQDRFPKEMYDGEGKFSLELYMQYMKSCNDLANQIAHASEVSLIEHKLLVLVDLQGLYLNLINWLGLRKFTLESGLILSRFAIFLIQRAITKIQDKLLAEAGDGSVLFEDLVNLVYKKSHESIKITKSVIKLEPRVELFFAPAPFEELESNLINQASGGSFAAKMHLNALRQGTIVLGGNNRRDYRFYDDFVQCLRRDPLVTRVERGFFNFYVGKDGINFIDEKEVDIRIAISAVDCCNNYDSDSICIVSSDQDFLALQGRCKKSGLRAYQAVCAKSISGQNIGKKIRGLGANFLELQIDPTWPLLVITEASAPLAIYRISEVELNGLCSLHNEMNEFQITPLLKPSGEVTLKMHRPL